MKLSSNKFFIFFLILTVIIYSISIKIAEAKGVASVFTVIAIAVVVVAAVVATGGTALGVGATFAGVTGVAASGIALGSAALISAAAITIGQLSCLSGSDNPMFTGCGGDNGGGGDGGGGAQGTSVASGNAPLNCWQINSTMYIPQLNGSGYNNQCALPLDETQSQIAIYRYSIPNSSSQSA